jgi:hypothetical protein
LVQLIREVDVLRALGEFGSDVPQEKPDGLLMAARDLEVDEPEDGQPGVKDTQDENGAP